MFASVGEVMERRHRGKPKSWPNKIRCMQAELIEVCRSSLFIGKNVCKVVTFFFADSKFPGNT